MKRLLYVSAALLLILAVWFCWNKQKPARPESTELPVAATNLPGADAAQPAALPIVANNDAASQPGNPPSDVLSATNLEQWKSLIKDLKQDKALRDNWTTSRSRPGTPPVLLKHNGQSIVYKAAAIDVSVVPRTTDFMEAQIYSPKMNIEETRALGLSLCGMFGFDSNKFQTWCNAVGTNSMDMPLFGIGDHSHSFNVRSTFNGEKPWYIIFTVQDQNAVSRLTQKH